MKFCRHDQSQINCIGPGIRSFLLSGIIFLGSSTLHAQSQDLVSSYIDRWADFYPSAAFGQGQKSAAFRFEDFSGQRVPSWLDFNRSVEQLLTMTPSDAPLDDRVDAQVLLRQVRLERELWEQDKVLTQQPQWYAKQISEALTYVLISEKFTPVEKYRAVLNRLGGIQSLCDLGIKQLENGNPDRLRGALNSLERTVDFYENELLTQSETWTASKDREDLRNAVEETTRRMRELAGHLSGKVLPAATIPGKLGPAVYARKLATFSDGDLTPEILMERALQEIELVRGLMKEVAAAWWAMEKKGQIGRAHV